MNKQKYAYRWTILLADTNQITVNADYAHVSNGVALFYASNDTMNDDLLYALPAGIWASIVRLPDKAVENES